MPNQNSSNESQWTIIDILKWTTPFFESHNIDSPRTCAEMLLAHVLQLKRIDLYLRYDQPLLASELAQYKALIRRRVRHEPAAYILGTKEFWSMDFIVNPDVLIPRPETECLVETALELLNAVDRTASQTILDLGTGSGAIVLALAAQSKQNTFFASDLSYAAVKVAQQNARQHGLDDRVIFVVGDWLQPFSTRQPRFGMIVSNPPYISRRDVKHLQPEITEYEPILALDGDESGLACIRQIVETACDHLEMGGHLVLEIGYDQAAAVKQLIYDNGHYAPAMVKKDYGGNDRVVLAQRI